MGILTKSWSLLLAHWFISQHEEPHTQIHRWPWHLYRLFSLYNLNMTPLYFAHKPPNWLLKATSLATTFSQCGVVWLHMESNSSYSLVNEARCRSVVAAGHAGNFWAMRTHNSNCQRIKKLGEKKISSNVSWQQKYFQVIKATVLRQLFCWRIFHMNQWFSGLYVDQQEFMRH